VFARIALSCPERENGGLARRFFYSRIKRSNRIINLPRTKTRRIPRT
jgi:hypothetical protein